MFAGTVTKGGVSRTVTTKSSGAATLPAGSEAVQWIPVVPIGKVEPELRPLGDELQCTAIAASSGSVAATSYETTAPARDVAVTVRLLGPCSTGGVESTYVFVRVHVFLPPAGSVTVPCASQSPEKAPA